MNYRREIDGLRALAVIPVILFHAGFEHFSGGFIGVDIFFVISGYLITSLLIDDLENNCFSFKVFYERRARRILPALFFIIIVSIPLSVTYLPPDEFTNYIQSLVAISVFASNILFWKESGYFDAEASQKPLLHTWSLSVEAQFYLLFPLFLAFAWRFGIKRIFSMIFLMGVLSFMLSEWGWRNSPHANFYLGLSRAWELFAGSLCALILRNNNVKQSNVISFVGLLAIIISVFLYDETTPFPSIYALLPILGCMLVILFAGEHTVIARALGIRPLVSIGLMSYSAYLVHQPLFVFSRISHLEELTPIFKFCLVLATFLLAFFIWKYIEKPARQPTKISRNHFFLLTAMISLSLLIFGFLYHLKVIPQKKMELYWGGVVRDVPMKFRGIELGGINCSDRKPENSCILGNSAERIVIAGDSHARTLTEAAYQQISDMKLQLIDLTASGCPFLIGLNLYSNKQRVLSCTNEYQRNRANFLKALSPSVIILHSRLPLYLHGEGFNNSIGGVEPNMSYHVGVNGHETLEQRSELIKKSFIQTVEMLLDYGHRVVVVTSVPTNGWHPIKRLNKVLLGSTHYDTAYIRKKMAVPRKSIEKRQFITNAITNQAQDQFPTVEFIDSSEILCDAEFCHAIANNGDILYSDRDHLSLAGAELIFSSIKKSIFKSRCYDVYCE